MHQLEHSTDREQSSCEGVASFIITFFQRLRMVGDFVEYSIYTCEVFVMEIRLAQEMELLTQLSSWRSDSIVLTCLSNEEQRIPAFSAFHDLALV